MSDVMIGTCPRYELALWECLEALDCHQDLQAAGMESLTLGAGHCQAARAMLWSLFHILRPQRIVETGTSHGLTSAFLWKLAAYLGHKPLIRTFDIARSTLAPTLWDRMGGADDITFVHGDSASLIPQTCTGGADFVLIDGDHTFAGAARDWRAIEPLLLSRSAVFFDNMDHIDGCGRFFATLEPLWFHPGMALMTRGLNDPEMQSVFSSYVGQQFSSWLRVLPAGQGAQALHHMRSLLALLQEPLPEAARRRAADLCRELTGIASGARFPSRSQVIAASARHNIGSAAKVRRQRIVEALPKRLRPWAERAYHLVKAWKRGGGRVQ